MEEGIPREPGEAGEPQSVRVSGVDSPRPIFNITQIWGRVKVRGHLSLMAYGLSGKKIPGDSLLV